MENGVNVKRDASVGCGAVVVHTYDHRIIWWIVKFAVHHEFFCRICLHFLPEIRRWTTCFNRFDSLTFNYYEKNWIPAMTRKSFIVYVWHMQSLFNRKVITHSTQKYWELDSFNNSKWEIVVLRCIFSEVFNGFSRLISSFRLR